MLVRLCSPGETLGEALGTFRFGLVVFDLANAGPATNTIDISKIDNKDAAKPQFSERPLRNGSMNSF
jgi:hypothetical protein